MRKTVNIGINLFNRWGEILKVGLLEVDTLTSAKQNSYAKCTNFRASLR